MLPHTLWRRLYHPPSDHVFPSVYRLQAVIAPVPDYTMSLPDPSMHSAAIPTLQVHGGTSPLPSSAPRFPDRQTPSYCRASQTGNLPQKASPDRLPPPARTDSVLSYNNQRYDTHLQHSTGGLHIPPFLPSPSSQGYLRSLRSTAVPWHSGSCPCIVPSSRSIKRGPMHNPAHPSLPRYSMSENLLYLQWNVSQTYYHNPVKPD